jgi:hypothetical protein
MFLCDRQSKYAHFDTHMWYIIVLKVSKYSSKLYLVWVADFIYGTRISVYGSIVTVSVLRV